MSTIATSAALVLSTLTGCGASDDAGELRGTWSGAAAGFTVTADIEAEYENAGTISLQGIMTTDRVSCFTNAVLAGTLVRSTVELVARGSGTMSGDTFVRVRGELAGTMITGQLEVIAEPPCEVASTPIVLVR